MALISFVSFNHCSPVSLFMYSISIPIMIWVLSSAAEPLAISKNLAFSFSVDRSMPSAMFDGNRKARTGDLVFKSEVF